MSQPDLVLAFSTNLSDISCNNETVHNYTLPKEDPKNVFWIKIIL